MEAEDNVFEIERILDSSVGKGIRYYRVRWKGFGTEEDTWEPEANLFDCKNVLDQYWKKAAQAKKARAKKRKSESASKFETAKAKKKKSGRTTNNSTIARIDSSSSQEGQIILPGEEKKPSDDKNSKRKQKRRSEKGIRTKKRLDPKQEMKTSSKGKENTTKRKKGKGDIDKNCSDENKGKQSDDTKQMLDENENKAEQSNGTKRMLDENENKRDTNYNISVEDKPTDEATCSKYDSNLQHENSGETFGDKSFERRSWSSYEVSPEYVPEYCDETLAYDICDEEQDFDCFGDTGYFIKDSVGYEQDSYFDRRESLDVDNDEIKCDKDGTKAEDDGKENEGHVDDDENHVDDDENHVDDDEVHVDDDEDHADDDEDHADDDEDHADDDGDHDHNDEDNVDNIDKGDHDGNGDRDDDKDYQVNDCHVNDDQVNDSKNRMNDDGSQLKKLDGLVDDKSKIGSTSPLREIERDTEIEKSGGRDTSESVLEEKRQISSATCRDTGVKENQEPNEDASLKTSDGQEQEKSLDKLVGCNTGAELIAKETDNVLKSRQNDDVKHDLGLSDVVVNTVSGDQVRTVGNKLTLKMRSSSSGESAGLTDGECMSPEFAKLPEPVKGYFDKVFAERMDDQDTIEPSTQEKGDKGSEVIKDDAESELENKAKDDSCVEVHEDEKNLCEIISTNADVNPPEKPASVDGIRQHGSVKDQPPIQLAKETSAFGIKTVEINDNYNGNNKYSTKDILSDTSLSKSGTVSNIVDTKKQIYSKTENSSVEKERKLSEEETAHCLLNLSSVRLGKSNKMETIETNVPAPKDKTDNFVESSITGDVEIRTFDQLESGNELSNIKPEDDPTKMENVNKDKQQFPLKRKPHENKNSALRTEKKCRVPFNLPFIEEDCKEVLDILDHGAKPAGKGAIEHSVAQLGSRKKQIVPHVQATSQKSSVNLTSASNITLEQKSTTTSSHDHSELTYTRETTSATANIKKHETLTMSKIRLPSLHISEKKSESVEMEKTKDNTENMLAIVSVSNVSNSGLISSQDSLSSPVLSSVSNEKVLQSQFIQTVKQPSTPIALKHSSPSSGNVEVLKITQVYGKGKYDGTIQGVDPVSWSGETTKTYPYSSQFSPSGTLHINSNLYPNTPSGNTFIVGHLHAVSPSSCISQFSQQNFSTQSSTHPNQKPFSAVAGINWYPDNNQPGPRLVPTLNVLPKPIYYVPEFPASAQHSKQPLHHHVYARALQEMAKRRQINSSGQSVSSEFINQDQSPPFDADRTLYLKHAGGMSSQAIQAEVQDGNTNVYPSIINQTDVGVRRLSNNIKVTIADSEKKDDLLSVTKLKSSETKFSSKVSETKEVDVIASYPSVSSTGNENCSTSKENTLQFIENENSDEKISRKKELECDSDKSKESKSESNVSESKAQQQILEITDCKSCSAKDDAAKVKDKNVNEDKNKGETSKSSSESNKLKSSVVSESKQSSLNENEQKIVSQKSSSGSDTRSSGNRSRGGSKERARDSPQDHKEKRSDSEKSRGKDKEISRKKEDSSKRSRSKERDRQSKHDSKGKELKKQESSDSELEFDFDEHNPGEVINEKSEKMEVSQSGIPMATSLREVKSAIKQGDSATVLASLAGGMNIDSQDSVTGMTLLMRAVSFGQENIVKLLLNHGANINIKDNTGSTPLIAACEQGFENIVSLLLNVEVDINAKQSASGETALIKACMKGHHSVVSMLLAHGADCQMRSVSGLTAAQLAVQCGQFEIRDLLESYSKKLQRCVETTIASCLCDSSKLMYPPLLPFVSLYPAEGQEFTYHFHCSNVLLSKTILLFCLRAIFSRSGEVDLSFSKDNGLHTVLLNGSLQSPVLNNNKSVFVLQPKLDTNRLILQTYQSHVHLLVCIYATEFDENSANEESSPMTS